MNKLICVACLIFSGVARLQAQEIDTLSSPVKASFRGLSITKSCIWISGSKGTIGRSTDQGKTWQWRTVKGYEKNDFRDIEAFDSKTAVIMGIAAPAYILKTADGGNTWTKAYENSHPAMFLDAMAFKNKRQGIVIGDPIDNKIFVAETNDGGSHWKETGRLELPRAEQGEAFFAASGGNIIFHHRQYYIVSGGSISRIFYDKQATKLPTTQGQQMTGANAIAIQNGTILIPGGNYKEPHKTDSAFTYSKDEGKTWLLPVTMPGGYRSSICFAGKNIAVACGVTGVDISYDRGVSWKTISNEGFNTCAYSQPENAVYFVGNNGRLGKLKL